MEIVKKIDERFSITIEDGRYCLRENDIVVMREADWDDIVNSNEYWEKLPNAKQRLRDSYFDILKAMANRCIRENVPFIKLYAYER